MLRKKILLVDDSSTALLAERMVLQQLALDIVTASNGEEAVAKAASERPDLILMDVVMPKMNGFDACRAIRAREDTKTIPIIMVTTRGESQNRELGYDAGCDDYITKPLNSHELVTKMRTLFGK
jgi:DNA-binding response OmpR family regulator